MLFSLWIGEIENWMDEKYISNNKEVLSVMPVNTKKNKSKYLETVEELEVKALKIRDIIWEEIKKRYNRIISVGENPKVFEIEKEISDIGNIEMFNELNTPYEKLGFNKINHSLGSFFEGDLNLVNENIKIFIDTFKEYGIILSEDDFNYSTYINEYMETYFEEYNSGTIDSDRLKKLFEKIYWKCPDFVTHIELNLRYLYNINSKKFEKELEERNERAFEKAELDKNGLVKKYFELNKSLIKLKRKDPKYIMKKFISEEWRISDFNDKSMEVLYDRLFSKDYYSLSKEEQDEVDINFGKLLNTLEEYNIYKRYRYIIDDVKAKYAAKDSFKDSLKNKTKELNKKEQSLLKENKKNKRLIKLSKNIFFKLFRKKIEHKIYEFPVNSNTQIKELKALYLEIDEEKVNDKIVEFADDNCTIKYAFKIVESYYSYLYNLVKKNHEEDDIDVEKEVNALVEFIDQPYKVMVNNIKLIEEPEITSIIANRYKILNIKIQKEDLEENLETVMQDVEKIVNFYNIRNSNINTDDVSFMEKVKPMIKKAGEENK